MSISGIMAELEVPSTISVSINGDVISIKGKAGSASKKFNTKYMSVKLLGSKLEIGFPASKKFEKMSRYMQTTIENQVKKAFASVENGIETKMQIVYSHFPISIDNKGKKLFIKNILGSRLAREANVVGDTKVEVKGQDITIKGSDAYDVGQTVANITKACETKGYDSRVFQDGIYEVLEE